MINSEERRAEGTRVHLLDNLRTVLIFLVVLFHVGGVYESSGFWASFWIVDDPATNDFVGILNVIVDIVVMPAMFFIAGFVTLTSLKKRNGWAFLKARFRRLIVPWAIAVLTLVPLYKVIFLYSRNLPQEEWTSYFHFSNGIFSQNWLWFLPVLFLFNLLYVLLSRLNLAPGRIPLKLAVLAVFLVGLATSFSMDIMGVLGWTKTALIDFQNERLLLYFMMFLLGSLCFRQNVFAAKPKGKKLYLAVSFTVWIPIVFYIGFLILPLINPGSILISPVVDRLVLWLSFYLGLLGLLYLLIETFWRYLDKPGRIWNELNQNSYAVYIIHMIVLGGIALLLLNTSVPSLLKYLTLLATTYLASNLLVSLYRRATASRRSQPSRASTQSRLARARFS